MCYNCVTNVQMCKKEFSGEIMNKDKLLSMSEPLFTVEDTMLKFRPQIYKLESVCVFTYLCIYLSVSLSLSLLLSLYIHICVFVCA